MIKILADQNLYKLDLFLPEGVKVSYYNPNKHTPSTKDFDAWLLRTVTKVNAQTLPVIPSSLRFIGTGSAGSDHLDIDYLTSEGLTVVNAKGCNANAVAEYVLTALLILREKKGLDFRSKKIGIIGVGAVGSAVYEKLISFDCEVVLYDPPRAERDITFESANIEEVKACDIITVHVPLCKQGIHKTHHLIDQDLLRDCEFDVFINTARGGVADENALLKAHRKNQITYLITDVWENEPVFNGTFVVTNFIATPHIAGHSEQSKLKASAMIVEQLCSFFDLQYTPPFLNENKQVELEDSPFDLVELISRCHPILEYDAALRDLIPRNDYPLLFSKLRTDRPYRYEYPKIRLKNVDLSNYPELQKLGVMD